MVVPPSCSRTWKKARKQLDVIKGDSVEVVAEAVAFPVIPPGKVILRIILRTTHLSITNKLDTLAIHRNLQKPAVTLI